MPVLTDPQINLITSKLQKILSAASSAITPVLTSTEFIGTFVDHNHYRQIKDVGDLIGGFPLASQCMTKITVDDMEADMQARVLMHRITSSNASMATSAAALKWVTPLGTPSTPSGC